MRPRCSSITATPRWATRRRVLAKALAAASAAAAATTASYVIITTSAIQAGTSQLSAFIADKQAMGYTRGRRDGKRLGRRNRRHGGQQYPQLARGQLRLDGDPVCPAARQSRPDGRRRADEDDLASLQPIGQSIVPNRLLLRRSHIQLGLQRQRPVRGISWWPAVRGDLRPFRSRSLRWAASRSTAPTTPAPTASSPRR